VSGEAGEATKKDQGIPNFKVTGVELEDVIFEDSKPESSEQVNTSGSIETDNKKDDSPPSVAPKLPPKLSSMPSIGGEKGDGGAERGHGGGRRPLRALRRGAPRRRPPERTLCGQCPFTGHGEVAQLQ
ncbi:unnamed protein product, partial [Heterosigma akashiwo]